MKCIFSVKGYFILPFTSSKNIENFFWFHTISNCILYINVILIFRNTQIITPKAEMSDLYKIHLSTSNIQIHRLISHRVFTSATDNHISITQDTYVQTYFCMYIHMYMLALFSLPVYRTRSFLTRIYRTQ